MLPCARRLALGLFSLASVLMGAAAHAEEAEGEADGAAVSLEVAYAVDFVAGLSGTSTRKLHVFDNLDVIADVDFEKLVGWQGARAHVYALANQGQKPNDAFGTLQGIDNIEVGQDGVRLFEAWVEQDIGPAALLVGIYDLNSEFYAIQAADQFLSPPFGIGSELAASGSNGPSIFPSTALGARLRAQLGKHVFAQAAVLNAHATTWGDNHGIDTSFNEGVLLIGELGYMTENWHATFGAWTYTKPRDIYYPPPPVPDLPPRIAQGLYGHAEGAVARLGEATLSGFARLGLSHGGTTPFSWSGQAGVRLEPVIPGRADSLASIGIAYARTSDGLRAEIADQGGWPSFDEYTIEVTFSDRLAPFLTVQPDLQIIAHPGGLTDARTAIVGFMRLTFELL